MYDSIVSEKKKFSQLRVKNIRWEMNTKKDYFFFSSCIILFFLLSNQLFIFIWLIFVFFGPMDISKIIELQHAVLKNFHADFF